MARKKSRHPFAAHDPPDQFKQAEQQERFTNAKKKRSDHIAGPMRAQINSRVTNRCGDKPVEPAAPPIKQRAVRGDDRVGYHVARWK